MHALRCRNYAIRKTHSPRQRRRNSVIAVAREQASNPPDRVAHRWGGRAHFHEFQHRNSKMLRQKNQRDKTTKEPAEPRKPVAAEELRPWVRKKLPRAFQHVIQPRSHQAAETRNPDDQKSFVVMARLFAFLQVAMFQETFAAPVEIRLQNICRDQESCRDHQPKCWNRKWAKMEERNHRQRSNSPSK